MRVECVDLRIRCASLRIPRWRVYATDHNGIRSRPLPLSLSFPRRVLFDAIRLGYVRLGELSSSRHTRACTHSARVRPASTRARDAPLNPVSPVSIGAACNGRTSREYARRGFERKSNPKGKANERPGRYARQRGDRPLPLLFPAAKPLPVARDMEKRWRSIDRSADSETVPANHVRRACFRTAFSFATFHSSFPRDLRPRATNGTDIFPIPIAPIYQRSVADPCSSFLFASFPPFCSRARHTARNARRGVANKFYLRP